MTLRVFNKVRKTYFERNCTIQYLHVKPSAPIDFRIHNPDNKYISDLIWNESAISFTYVKRNFMKNNTIHKIELSYKDIEVIQLEDEDGFYIKRRSNRY